MGQAISRLTIKGYKSIRSLENFELRNLNILIGPNGAGKSNFVSFFRLLRALVEGNLQIVLNSKGGASKQLFLGPKVTELFSASMQFGHNAYEFTLIPTTDDRLIFRDERIVYDGYNVLPVDRSIGSGHSESVLKEQLTNQKNQRIVSYIYPAISSWIVYHFHDTSEFARVKFPCSIRDNEYLRTEASNLAAFLLRLKINNENEYNTIKEVVQLAVPFFDDFVLKGYSLDQDTVTLLEWKQKGTDYPFHPSQISDGTLRFICLATSLLQPNPPSTILLDEPELGLHPYALGLLAGLIQKASARTQVIVSTQSAALIDHFQPDDIVIVERQNGESLFRRLNKPDLSVWLEDYSLGDLWQRNILGGRPSHE
ncbi:MAG TPA: AAA family ATPase [Anaerohalosphaeraceae bacterium]|nr:AAA family ATPase [Anaerohalosphaeraceae bacterium]